MDSAKAAWAGSYLKTTTQQGINRAFVLKGHFFGAFEPAC
jgi:hypothetical protein